MNKKPAERIKVRSSRTKTFLRYFFGMKNNEIKAVNSRIPNEGFFKDEVRIEKAGIAIFLITGIDAIFSCEVLLL